MAKGVSSPITSSDLAFARDGEKKEVVAFETDVMETGNWATNDVPKSEEKFVIFKLVDNTKQGGVHIHGVDDVVNPKTGGVERIRCLLGVESIWMKDQKDLTPEYVRQNQRTFTFYRGAKILRIPETDKSALEFLTITNHNIGNPKRKTGSRFEFYEYNPMKQQEEALKKEMLEIEMAIQASKEPVESMRKHANYLGIQAFDEFGIPKSDDGMRKEYIITAKRNSERFQKTLNSKEVEVSYLLKKAISENLIDLGGHSGNVTWGAGGFIASIPEGRNTHEYLVTLALDTTSSDGRKFLERLQSLASKK
jgi:hypothetical protein